VKIADSNIRKNQSSCNTTAGEKWITIDGLKQKRKATTQEQKIYWLGRGRFSR